MQDTLQNPNHQIINQHSNQIAELLQAEFNTFKNSADFVAFKFIKEKTRDFSVRNGKTEDLNEFNDQGLLIEIMINGHMGYGATAELTKEGIKKAFNKARAMTLASSQYSLFKFDKQIRPAAKGRYETKRKIKLDQLSLAEVYDFLKKTSLALKKMIKLLQQLLMLC